MASRIVVRIYGKEYTVIGDKPEEEILGIAKHVDKHMKQLAKHVEDKSAGSLAVLSAVNISEEYFDTLKQVTRLLSEKEALEKENEYHRNMLEETQKTSVKSLDSMEELRENIRESDEKIRKLREKCNEYENSFFDLQMENIQLKSELEKLKLKND